MRVEIQLERSVQPIVHEYADRVEWNETEASVYIDECEEQHIVSYVLRNVSWIKESYGIDD